MALQKIVRIVYSDDIDGTEGAAPVTFAFEGKQYEIDLNDEHQQQLRDALAVFIKAARPKGGKASTKTTSPNAGKGGYDEDTYDRVHAVIADRAAKGKTSTAADIKPIVDLDGRVVGQLVARLVNQGRVRKLSTGVYTTA